MSHAQDLTKADVTDEGTVAQVQSLQAVDVLDVTDPEVSQLVTPDKQHKTQVQD